MDTKKRPLQYEQQDSSRSGAGELAAALIVSALGVMPLLLGVAWLYNFVLTDYRAHHRPIMIPLGLVATLVGLAMVCGPWVLRWLIKGASADSQE